MRIGIDIRLKNETGVGRYIRNLTSRLKIFDKKNEYVLIDPPIRWHSFLEQVKMPRVYKSYNVDLVHIPYFNVPLTFNNPFVVTIHDVIVDHFPTGRASTYPLPVYKLKRLAYKKTMKHAVSKAKAVIVPSIATKQALVDLYPIDDRKIYVVYEGIDNALNRELATNNLQLNNQFFLYVGNAYPHKNLKRLIQAFKIFNKQQTIDDKQKTKLILVGKEDFFYKKLKEKIADSAISKYILFTGHVSDSQLSWLYRNALAMVCPSLMEGFGLPVLEAMSNKCLVLASDISAFNEICKSGAVYFDPDRPEAIAGLLADVVTNNEKYSSFISNGLKRSNEFSWDKMTKKTIHIYESCISL